MKQFRFSLLLLAAVLLFTACMPQYYTDELKAELETEFFPRAERYFADNLPRATVQTKFIHHEQNDITNLVEGIFYHDGEYLYCYNPDEDVLYSSELCDTVKEYIGDYYAAELGIDRELLKVDDNMWFTIRCHAYRNTNGRGKEVSMQEIEQYVAIGLVDRTADDAALHALAEEADDITLRVTIPDVDGFLEKLSDFSFFAEHYHIDHLFLKETPDSEVYYLVSRSSITLSTPRTFTLTRHTKDENGNYISEVIASGTGIPSMNQEAS